MDFATPLGKMNKSNPITRSGGLSKTKKGILLSSKRKLQYPSQQCKELSSEEEYEFTMDTITVGNRTILPAALPTSSPTSFRFRMPPNQKVTSVTLCPQYRFLLGGFSDGTIRYYPLTQSTPDIVLAQIQGRGMYTNLNLHVELSQDGRYGFAGVYRGATETLVLDMTTIHAEGCTTYSYSDAKLKGLGAVGQLYQQARAGQLQCVETNGSWYYYLLCGLGIKNMHVWRFHAMEDIPKWECIFDKATNGLTLEMFRFLSPTQVISKSENQNVRVWDLSACIAETTEQEADVVYEDIPNSADVLEVYGQFAYGGGERLVVIDLQTHLRTELELDTTATSNTLLPSRRRRQIRMIKRITGVSNPTHVIALCSDGTTWFHQHTSQLGVHTPVFDLKLDWGCSPAGAFIALAHVQDTQPVVITATNSEISIAPLVHPALAPSSLPERKGIKLKKKKSVLPFQTPKKLELDKSLSSPMFQTPKHVTLDTKSTSKASPVSKPIPVMVTPKPIPVMVTPKPTTITTTVEATPRSIETSHTKTTPRNMTTPLSTTKTTVSTPRTISSSIETTPKSTTASPFVVATPKPKPKLIPISPEPSPEKTKPRIARPSPAPKRTKPNKSKIVQNNAYRTTIAKKVYAQKHTPCNDSPCLPVQDHELNRFALELAEERNAFHQECRRVHERLYQSFQDEIQRQQQQQQALLSHQQYVSGGTFLWKKHHKMLANRLRTLPQLLPLEQIVQKYQAIVHDTLQVQNLEAQALIAKHRMQLMCLAQDDGPVETLLQDAIPMATITFPYQEHLKFY